MQFGRAGRDLLQVRVVAERARARDADVEDLADPAGPGTHHDDAVGEQHRFLDGVGDEDRGRAERGVDVLQLDRQFLAGEGVEGGERLVHQQDARLRQQRPAQGDALLHAAGQLVGQALVEAGQPDRGEEMVGALEVRGPAARFMISAGSMTLASTERHGRRAGRWNIIGDVASRGWVTTASSTSDLAGGGRQEAGDDPQQRGLAAAGPADDGDELALGRSSGRPIRERRRGRGAS